MRRVASHRPLAITERDVEVLRCLARYRYLRSTYLHAFAGGASDKRFVERLCELFHRGMVARPAQQWQFADARCQPLVYEQEPRAGHLLTRHETAPCTYLGSNAQRQFLHALTICECLASIELAASISDDLRFIPWGEILDRAPEATRTSAAPFRLTTGAKAIIPDGIFGIEYRSGMHKAYRFFALEVDRGTMPVVRAKGAMSSIAAKLSSYSHFIATGGPRSVLGIPNLFVLTVVPNAERTANAIAAAAGSKCAPWFLFKAVDEKTLQRPLASLVTEAWERGGLPSLAIARPD